MATKPLEAELYNGEVEIRRGANHVYRVRVKGGKSYPTKNVTSVIGMKDKSRALMPWQAKVIAYVVEKRTKALVDMLPAEGVTFKMKEGTRGKMLSALRELKDAVFSATDEVRDLAGDVGTQVHAYIEDYLTAKMQKKSRAPGTTGLDKEVKRAVGHFARWFVENEVEVVAVERILFSRQHFYSGTLDYALRVGGVLGPWDAKTGKSVYPEVMLQTAAYREAWNEEFPHDPMESAGGVLFFGREETDPVTKFLTGDFEAIHLPGEMHDENFAAFLGLLTTSKWDNKAYKALRAARGD